MKRIVVALVAGLLFGAGLAWSGMANPARVQGFLDVFGAWDATLAFVMGGAMIPMAFAWMWQKRLTKPLADTQFDLPETTELNGQLALGGVLFGVGWGISGLCPGPAIADLAIAPTQAGLFVLAMLAGMAVHRFTTH